MKKGWVKIHRKVLDNAFCRNNSERLGFWILLLLEANHDQQDIFIGQQKIQCLSGQFITGRKKLSQKCGVSEMKVERWLSCLEKEHQIEQQKNNKCRIITILKWKNYQIDEQQNAQQMNNKRTTDEQQMNTNKNVKNDKNEKNRERKYIKERKSEQVIHRKNILERLSTNPIALKELLKNRLIV